tara:strand:- start:3765 stop:4046 length:282 start_codon:yes stop_codon:yes gene_type:complete
MFSLPCSCLCFEKSEEENSTKIYVNPTQKCNESSGRLEPIEEEKDEETLKSFGITDDEISNLKNAKKTDISKAINNAEMDESMRGFLHKFLSD